METFYGEVRGDSIHLPGGITRTSVQIVEVQGDRGWRASARGSLYLYSGDNLEISLGSLIVFPGPIFLGDYSAICEVEEGSVNLIGWSSPVFEFRAKVLKGIRHRIAYFKTATASLLTALILGVRDDPAAPEFSQFRRAGCMHILALSGFHLGIIAVIFSLLLRPLFGKTPAFWISLLAIGGYLVLVGARPSLLRAALMYALGGGLLRFDIVLEPADLLALVFVILASFQPGGNESLSFQLSFLALFGMLSFSPAIDRALRPYLPPFISAPIAASAAAQLVTAPLLVARFGILHPVGIIASLVITPLITVLMCSGLLFLIVSLLGLPVLERAMMWEIDLVYAAIAWAGRLFSSLPGLRVASAWWPGLAVLPVILYIRVNAGSFLRLASRNRPIARISGFYPEKEIWPELSHKSRGPKEDR